MNPVDKSPDSVEANRSQMEPFWSMLSGLNTHPTVALNHPFAVQNLLKQPVMVLVFGFVVVRETACKNLQFPLKKLIS